ncbi:unnamed protein product, partial [Nesidiocoris tenuis]
CESHERLHMRYPPSRLRSRNVLHPGGRRARRAALSRLGGSVLLGHVALSRSDTAATGIDTRRLKPPGV